MSSKTFKLNDDICHYNLKDYGGPNNEVIHTEYGKWRFELWYQEYKSILNLKNEDRDVIRLKGGRYETPEEKETRLRIDKERYEASDLAKEHKEQSRKNWDWLERRKLDPNAKWNI